MDIREAIDFITPAISAVLSYVVFKLFRVTVRKELIEEAILIIKRIVKEIKEQEVALNGHNNKDEVIDRSTRIATVTLTKKQQKAVEREYGSLKGLTEVLYYHL